METLNFEESIAKGCALQCALLSPKFKVRDYKIEDLTPHGVSLSWHTLNDPADTKVSNVTLFKPNNILPNPKNITFKRKGLKPFVIEAKYADKTALVEGTEEKVATFTMPRIPKPHHGGDVAEIRVKINLTEHGTIQGDGAIMKELYTPPPSPEPPKKKKQKVEKTAKADEKKEAPKEGEQPKDAEAPKDAEKPKEGAPEPMDTDTPQKQGDAMEVDEPKTPEPKAPKPKLTRWTTVECNVSSLGFDTKSLATLVKKENDLTAADNEAIMVQDAKNALESYCYESRDKLSMSWKDFASADESERLKKMTMDIEDWLYDEGEDETKQTYETKLAELTKIGNAIQNRATEFAARGPALKQFYDTLAYYRSFVASTEEKYAHIDAEERAKVEKECSEAEASIKKKEDVQVDLAKTDDPVLLAADVVQRRDNLNTFCAAIMNKPKPAPKKEEKPKEDEKSKEETEGADKKPESPDGSAANGSAPSPEAAAPAPEAVPEPATEASAEQPKDDPMDMD